MFSKIFAIAAALAASASAHMDIIQPCPRFGPNCIKKPATLPAGASWDYNMKNPIPSDGILCKSNTPWPSPVETWTAGQPITVSFEQGGAAHGGGHCQFSISYDNGQTFAVIHEVLQYCFFNGPSNGNSAEVLSYTFNLPSNLPSSDKAVFAWSWVNAIGNREFYMNCADVAIQGGSSSSYSGKQITIANHDRYPTIPEFNGDYTTGLEYYKNATMITVSPSGTTGSGSGSGSSSAVAVPSSVATPLGHAVQGSSTVVASSAPAATTEVLDTTSDTEVVSSAPATSADPAPTTESLSDPGNTPGSCTQGAMKCSAGGSGYTVCVWGTWVNTISCPTGTVCKPYNGAIICDWP
ncbi:hypothetical protein GGI25_003640 [Coemansia spiralis]|uniref:Chitin-binding type-4 domain-containing protein n=2 Tax=Coemansia TaxID=4863 RepID=A0A9W8G1R0_9FUNG|nr:hypothetical protein EDC05_000021 [Coemansia umbellata]KAJ2626112.1 hypothetical protein GGI26_000196 [Coemansia sp. RSA 1358]KAJ2676253.1 hypothetical protein GGI25_003640 [Coemansia spiralis]